MKNTDWSVIFNGHFFEVLPEKDSKDHLLGDECWCNPRVEHSVRAHPKLRGTPFDPVPYAQPVIAHNSHDGREKLVNQLKVSEPAP